MPVATGSINTVRARQIIHKYLFCNAFQHSVRTTNEPIALKQGGAIGVCPSFAITRRILRGPLPPTHGKCPEP